MKSLKIVIFEIFSNDWWISNLLVLSITIFLAILPYFNSIANKSNYPKLIGLFLFINLVVESVYGVVDGSWSVKGYLPFHLCYIASILSFILLIRYQNKLAQIFFYWGLTGAFAALVYPVFLYGIDGYHYFSFYIAHGGIVFTCLYMILHFDFRPMKNYWWKSFLYIQFAALIVIVVNKLLDSNYMFLAEAPPVSNPLLNFPWPWYIITYEISALVGFWGLFVLYNYVTRIMKPIYIKLLNVQKSKT
jgi:hypothetical integral membrane protein (TIGR02206 family)